MATVKATGLDASVTFLTQHGCCADMYQLTRTQQLIEVSCFGSTGAEFLGGLQGGSFAVEGKPIYNNTSTSPGFAEISGTPGSVTFTVATGCTVAIGCLVTSMTLRAVHGGESRLAYAGVTSGTPTETWDES